MSQPIFAPNSPLAKTFSIAKKIAIKKAPVFINGETGTGKEILAKFIHQHSNLTGALVNINCSTLDHNLMDSELFGHVKGAFTGANEAFEGKLKAAHKGTLFLDELAELPLEVQAKLLRALQEKKFTPIGSTKEVESDFRILSASHKDLKIQVKKSLFQEDLFYRLHVFPLYILPLRQRGEDVLLLADYFWKKLQQSTPMPDLITTEKEVLLQHPFLGNVRELQNVLEQYSLYREVGMNLGELLNPLPIKEAEIIPNNWRATQASFLKTKVFLYKEALKRNSFNVSKTARELGISRGALSYQLSK